MNIRTCFVAILSILCLSDSITAHEGSNLAMRISLSEQIDRNWSVLVEEDLRTGESLSSMQWLLSVAEINYTICPALSGGIGYTNLFNFHDHTETRHRYYLYVQGNYSIRQFRLSLQERFQSTYNRKAAHPTNYLRSKLTVSYRLPSLKLEPFVYVEPFNNTGYRGKLRTDRIRLSGGTTYRITPKNSLQIYYRYHIFNRFDPVNYRHAFGIVYQHKL